MNIQQNTFAAACYEQNSIEELQNALKGEADATDCTTWNISEGEWRKSIETALYELTNNVEK